MNFFRMTQFRYSFLLSNSCKVTVITSQYLSYGEVYKDIIINKIKIQRKQSEVSILDRNSSYG